MAEGEQQFIKGEVPPEDEVLVNPDKGRRDRELDVKAREMMPGLQVVLSEARKRTLDDIKQLLPNFTPDEQRVLGKLTNLIVEKARVEYLESIRANPANTLISLLREVADEDLDERQRRILESFLSNINVKVASFLERVKEAEASLVVQGRREEMEQGAALRIAIFGNLGGGDVIAESFGSSDKTNKLIQTILARLNAFPGGEELPVDRLREIVAGLDSPQDERGLRFSRGSNAILNLPINRQGLDGLKLILGFAGDRFASFLRIFGDEVFWERVVKNGNFIPYAPQPPAKQQ